MSGCNFQMQSLEKKEEEDGRERVEKEGTVTNQRENVHWKWGRLRSVVRGLVEIPSEIDDREREQRCLKIVVRTR